MPPTQNDEKQKEIKRLEEQVMKAESKGLTDTCHHEMLKRAKGEKPNVKEKQDG